MTSKIEKKKLLLKRKILQTTMHLIDKSSYDDVTMEEIARSSGITKRTLYKYYPVKEAIIAEFVKATFDEKKESRIVNLIEKKRI